MIFAKYEFPLETWETLKPLIYQNEQYTNCAVVELGTIGENPNHAVDIAWYNEIPTEFNQYEVFPNPIGIHTFMGCEQLYQDRFCQFNPDSPFCQVQPIN